MWAKPPPLYRRPWIRCGDRGLRFHTGVSGALDAVGRGGTLEFFAALYDVNYDFPLNLQAAFFKEVTIVAGVFQSPYAFPRTLGLFKVLDIDTLMSDGCIFEAEQYQEAFEAQMKGKTIKSVLKF